MRKALRAMKRYEASLVKQAMWAEWKVRRNAFDQLQAQGHVSIMQDEKPDVIRVRVDEEYFTDSRADFPTSYLMARIQLAVNAGQSDRNAPRMGRDSHTMDAFQYGTLAHQQIERFYPLKPGYMLEEGGDYLFGDKSPVTATVKPLKFKKGLRP